MFDEAGVTLPYDNSMLSVRLIEGFNLTNGSTVHLTIYDANGIHAYCGFPSSEEYYSDAYQSRMSSVPASITSVPMIASREVYHNGSYGRYIDNFTSFHHFPAVGEGCLQRNNCFSHGLCDFCHQKCLCDSGYGNYGDVIVAGLSNTSMSCKSSKFLRLS